MAGPSAAAGDLTRGIHLSQARARGTRFVAQAGPARASQDGKPSQYPESDNALNLMTVQPMADQPSAETGADLQADTN